MEAFLADPKLGLVLAGMVLLLGLVFVLGLIEVLEQQTRHITERDERLWPRDVDDDGSRQIEPTESQETRR